MPLSYVLFVEVPKRLLPIARCRRRRESVAVGWQRCRRARRLLARERPCGLTKAATAVRDADHARLGVRRRYKRRAACKGGGRLDLRPPGDNVSSRQWAVAVGYRTHGHLENERDWARAVWIDGLLVVKRQRALSRWQLLHGGQWHQCSMHALPRGDV